MAQARHVLEHVPSPTHGIPPCQQVHLRGGRTGKRTSEKRSRTESFPELGIRALRLEPKVLWVGPGLHRQCLKVFNAENVYPLRASSGQPLTRTVEMGGISGGGGDHRDAPLGSFRPTPLYTVWETHVGQNGILVYWRRQRLYILCRNRHACVETTPDHQNVPAMPLVNTHLESSVAARTKRTTWP